MRRLTALLPVLILAACAAPPAGADKAQAASRYPVQVQPVEERVVDVEVTAPATVSTFETMLVTAQVGGQLTRVLAREGDRIAAGQVVAEIDPERFAIQVDQAKAVAAAAEAVHADASAALLRRETLARTPGLVSPLDLDQARARTAQARAEVARARAALAAAELDARRSRVAAPAAGTVQERLAVSGGFVQPGAGLFTLVQREPLLLRFAVTAQDAALLRPGMPCSFTADGAEGVFAASLVLVSEAAGAQSRQVAVVAEVAAERSSLLRGNAYAQVRVPVQPPMPTLAVPDLAVRPSERGFLAFVLAPDGQRVQERVVQLGRRTRDGAVVVREGLAAGERVVVRGAEPLRDGALVAVEAAAPAATGAEALR